ncbi:hypothetical protein FRB91_005672 [Serendipita sp. 411]|nr:hypothetical protein FRB91_005672 [Serendipita sp. 411]
MFKNILLVLSTLLVTVIIPMTVAQCTNGACKRANSLYNWCHYTTLSAAGFKNCLCTAIFHENYRRCLGGTVCPWDGTDGPCIEIFCPGTFAGGFDAAAFCADGSTTSTLESIDGAGKPSSSKKTTDKKNPSSRITYEFMDIFRQ